jgi:RNA polymerase sigma factor (sigma-70 family)
MTRNDLILSHWGYAKAVAYNRGLDQEDIDIATEALILAVDDYDPSRGATLRTYIALKVKYMVLDHFLGIRKRNEISLESVPEPSMNGTEQKIVDKDMAFKVMRYAKVMSVPKDAYTMLRLRYFHDIDQKEISKKCGINQGRVSAVIRDATSRIRARIPKWK